MKIITKELLLEGISPAGGWNKKQIESLGLRWPLHPGWQDKLIGLPISDARAAAFISLTGTNPKKTPRKRKVNSNLSFLEDCPNEAKRTVNSFWVWLERQPRATRNSVNDALAYMLRKNTQFIL